MDTRTAVWVSAAEKTFKIVLGETRNVSQKLRGVSAPALYKILDAAFLLTVGSFLLTVELFYLQLAILAFCLQLELFCLQF